MSAFALKADVRVQKTIAGIITIAADKKYAANNCLIVIGIDAIDNRDLSRKASYSSE